MLRPTRRPRLDCATNGTDDRNPLPAAAPAIGPLSSAAVPFSIEVALVGDADLVDPAGLIDAVSATFPDGVVQTDRAVDGVWFTADRPATLVDLAGPLWHHWQSHQPGAVLRLVGLTGDAELRPVDSDQAVSVLRGYIELLGPIEVPDAGDT
jgi:hypothetical protein